MRPCPFCAEDIPNDSERCEHCASVIPASWRSEVETRTPSQVKHWRGPDLTGYWIVGVILSLVGGGLLSSQSTSESEWGIAVLAAGAVLLQIAVIATGVSLGMRHRDGFNRIYDLDD